MGNAIINYFLHRSVVFNKNMYAYGSNATYMNDLLLIHLEGREI